MDSYGIVNILVYFICFVTGLFVSTILHELGHLICGRLSGYQFVSFRFMKWLWTKDDTGKLKLTKGARLGGIAGQCLMMPPTDEKDFRFVLYNSGGALFNFFMGVVLLVPFFFIENDIIRFSLFGVGVSALYLGSISLIPMKIGGIPNDGKNIIEAFKSAYAKHGFYMMLKINGEMSKGKRLQDYDEDTFRVGEKADTSNYFIAYMILLHSSHLEETGAYEQSYQELLRPDLNKLPPFYNCQFLLSMMFHELVYFGDESSVCRARERVEAKAKDKLFQKIMKMKHSAFLPFYAAKKVFLDGDTDKARELIAQARELNPSQQNPGLEHSVTLMLDKLESRMKEI